MTNFVGEELSEGRPAALLLRRRAARDAEDIGRRLRALPAHAALCVRAALLRGGAREVRLVLVDLLVMDILRRLPRILLALLVIASPLHPVLDPIVGSALSAKALDMPEDLVVLD